MKLYVHLHACLIVAGNIAARVVVCVGDMEVPDFTRILWILCGTMLDYN